MLLILKKIDPRKILICSFLYIILFLALTASGSDTQSQITTGTTIAAIAGNIVLPGLGHAIIGNKRKANYYLLGDMLLSCGVLFSGLYSSRPVYEASKYFAYEHAYASLKVTDQKYWEDIGDYSSTEQYNEEMGRIYRTTARDYTDPSVYWRWDDIPYSYLDGQTSSRTKYREMRKQEADERNNKRIVGNIMWGLVAGMVVDRIVSTVDLGLSMRKKASLPVSVNVESNLGIERQYIGLVFTLKRK
jgi:hypothetical protein